MCLLVTCASQVLPHQVETNLNVSTVQYPPRQVPVQGAYQEKLERLRQADIPEQVHNEYVPWVNSTVVTRKHKIAQIFAFAWTPHDLNEAIQCTPYYVKTIDDVIHVPKVSGASHFSILNTRSVGSGK